MKLKEKPPTDEQWKRLYELAAELKKLAPWEWLDETEIFGVENPETKEIGFVSAMGMLGEHLSIGVYLGAAGLYGFWDFQMLGEAAEPFALFEIPQLQVSFEDREGLEKQDREVMKKLDLKFRGRQNYPLFRSIRPGFLPWFITSDEAQMLIYAVEQTLEVAPRARENPALLKDESDSENEIVLIRAAEKQNGKLVWRDERREIPPPDEMQYSIAIPPEAIPQLCQIPQTKNLIVEIDLFYAPTPVAERGKRPFVPKMLMFAERASGSILGFQILHPQPTAAENFEELADHVLAALESLGTRPQEILVGADELFALLKNFTQALNIKLRQTDDLPAIEAARQSMFGFFGGSSFF